MAFRTLFRVCCSHTPKDTLQYGLCGGLPEWAGITSLMFPQDSPKCSKVETLGCTGINRYILNVSSSNAPGIFGSQSLCPTTRDSLVAPQPDLRGFLL